MANSTISMSKIRRAYRPRDKALVEGAVKIMYTRIYAPLRKAVFHSLAELNAAIRVVLEVHNSQLLQGRNYSRRLQFEEVERPALAPLPVLLYEFKKQHQHYANIHILLMPFWTGLYMTYTVWNSPENR